MGDTDFCGYVGDTDVCEYVCLDLLIHPQPFTFFFRLAGWPGWGVGWGSPLCLYSPILFFCCNLLSSFVFLILISFDSGNQPLILTGSAEAGPPILRPPDVKSRLTGKTLMLGKTEGRRRRG